MLRKLWSPLRRLDRAKLGARVGKSLAVLKPAGRPLLFAGIFAFVVLLIHREVYSFIIDRPQYRVPDIQASVAPKWGADGRGAEVVRVGGDSLYDRDLVERVGKAFEANPWVRRVTAVERIFPDRLRVRFEYRRPHAAVRRSSGYVLVDAEGVRLPGVYAEAPACDRTAVISGTGPVPAAPGRAWDDAALRAGLEMADFVHGDPLLARLGIREIDVSNVGGRLDPRRSEIALVTAGGCSIEWGRPPSRPRFGEPSTREKLASLKEILTYYPALEGLRCAKLQFGGSKAVEPKDSWVKKPKK